MGRVRLSGVEANNPSTPLRVTTSMQLCDGIFQFSNLSILRSLNQTLSDQAHIFPFFKSNAGLTCGVD